MWPKHPPYFIVADYEVQNSTVYKKEGGSSRVDGSSSVPGLVLSLGYSLCAILHVK